MNYQRVQLGGLGYELPPNVVSSAALEARLAPFYERFHLPAGQLAYLTGIRERRFWNAEFRLSDGAFSAAEKALEQSGVEAKDLGAVVYGGVCRENHEPATACRVAALLGVPRAAAIFDLSNACLGVLSGMVAVANMIELGQIRAGLVVSCESAREINDAMINEMLSDMSLARFKLSFATLTGGSGAVAVVLTNGSFGPGIARLVGGALRAAPEHHELCRWGAGDKGDIMETDAVAVLKHGVALGALTWEALMDALGWQTARVDKTICHQVGSANRQAVLSAIGVPVEKDFTTFEFLGNIGTVSLPLTAAVAAERGFLSAGDKVAFLGIGSGLNCLMMGLEWL